jgi:hypothetical protein
MTNGSATRRAAAAAPGSPTAIASSTLWTKLRIWLRCDRLTHAHLDGLVFQGLPGDWLSGVRISPASNKGKGVNSMICPRFIVFDDAPQHRRFGWTADQFADALRSPLAAIGVRVVRQYGARSNSPMAGFHTNTKLNTVDHVVNGVMKRLAKKE